MTVSLTVHRVKLLLDAQQHALSAQLTSVVRQTVPHEDGGMMAIIYI